MPGSFIGLTSLIHLSLSGTQLCAPTDAAFQAWLGGIGDRRGVVNCLELTDRGALIALYNAADGPNWRTDTNWLSDRPLGEWHGVRTAGNGPVTGLYLNDNRLRGEIPAELGGLARLERLVLYQNQLGGKYRRNWAASPTWRGWTFPATGSNRLSGEIPAELGSLANLRWLVLYQNQLGGAIPAELGGLANLEGLELHSNQLRGETGGASPTWRGWSSPKTS